MNKAHSPPSLRVTVRAWSRGAGRPSDRPGPGRSLSVYEVALAEEASHPGLARYAANLPGLWRQGALGLQAGGLAALADTAMATAAATVAGRTDLTALNIEMDVRREVVPPEAILVIIVYAGEAITAGWRMSARLTSADGTLIATAASVYGPASRLE